jgi:hypothetical protein
MSQDLAFTDGDDVRKNPRSVPGSGMMPRRPSQQSGLKMISLGRPDGIPESWSIRAMFR